MSAIARDTPPRAASRRQSRSVDRSSQSCRNARRQLDHHRVEAVVVPQHREAARRACDGFQLLRTGDVERERLLADDVLPGAQRRAGERDMQVVRGADVHDLRVGARHEGEILRGTSRAQRALDQDADLAQRLDMLDAGVSGADDERPRGTLHAAIVCGRDWSLRIGPWPRSFLSVDFVSTKASRAASPISSARPTTSSRKPSASGCTHEAQTTWCASNSHARKSRRTRSTRAPAKRCAVGSRAASCARIRSLPSICTTTSSRSAEGGWYDTASSARSGCTSRTKASCCRTSTPFRRRRRTASHCCARRERTRAPCSACSPTTRSEEHTSELRHVKISYAVFC